MNLSNTLSLILFVAICGSAFADLPCEYNNSTQEDGSSFDAVDGCNKCFCNNGSVSCFYKMCPQCEHNGKKYDVGQEFPRGDGCNNCSCRKNGRVSCSFKACTIENKVRDMEASPCEYNNKVYGVGEVFGHIDHCNVCSCGITGQPLCSFKTCNKPYTCFYNGQWYHDKEGFESVDGCNECQCLALPNGEGVESCTRMLCEKPKRDIEMLPCTHNGKVYQVGETFMDDCNRCSCVSGGLKMCTEMGCPQNGCYANGKRYRVGQVYPSGDGCNVCRCTEKEPACSRRTCSQCRVGDKVYPVKQRFMDRCNSCVCMPNGRPRCTRMRCQGCEHKGKWYSVNTLFDDGCNKCQCTASGRAACFYRACPNNELE